MFDTLHSFLDEVHDEGLNVEFGLKLKLCRNLMRNHTPLVTKLSMKLANSQLFPINPNHCFAISLLVRRISALFVGFVSVIVKGSKRIKTQTTRPTNRVVFGSSHFVYLFVVCALLIAIFKGGVTKSTQNFPSACSATCVVLHCLSICVECPFTPWTSELHL